MKDEIGEIVVLVDAAGDVVGILIPHWYYENAGILFDTRAGVGHLAEFIGSAWVPMSAMTSIALTEANTKRITRAARTIHKAG